MRLCLSGFMAVYLIWINPVAAHADTVTHVHASQRYDRPIPSLVREVSAYARRPVSLVTFTEVQGRARSAPLHRRGDGWAGLTRTRTDVGVMWRRDRWRAVWGHGFRVTDRTYVTRGGFTRTTVVLAVLLRPVGGGPRLLVTVGHPPPHRPPYWAAAVHGWAALTARLTARWHPGDTLTVADWNVSLRTPGMRHRIGRLFPGWHTWRRPFPTAGTWGASALIDGSLFTGRGRARLLPDTAASDHRPYIERLPLDD